MASFSVPLSSSPQIPSTPQSVQLNKSFLTKSPSASAKSSFAPNPSTTPAGPPPSSVGSFTPADPPPSSIFNSSQLGSGKTLFRPKGSSGVARKISNHPPPSSIDSRKLAKFLDGNSDFDLGHSNGISTKNRFGIPSSSPLSHAFSDQEDENYEDNSDVSEGQTNVEISADEDTMAMDSGRLHDLLDLDSPIAAISNRAVANGTLGSSLINTSPRGTKRSRGDSRLFNVSQNGAKRPQRSKYESAIPSIARSMANRLGVAEMQERDDFIIGTENIIQQDLYGAETLGDNHGHALNAGLPKVSEKLGHFWRTRCAEDLARLPLQQESIQGIGPNESAPSVHKATFLAVLLLQLRHPPLVKGKQALAITRLNRSSIRSRSPEAHHVPSNPTAMPKLLVDWLNHSHDPYGPLNVNVQRFQPNPTAHVDYWDFLYSLTLRGKIADIIYLLKRSDFRHAHTAKDDRKDGDGYSRVQIRNIERVINRAIQLLEHCPSFQDENWDVTGNEWILFRKRVEQAKSDLATFAEGRDRENDSAESTLEASNFGLRSTTMGLSQSARKAESQVPWSIYENLKAIYGILLGESITILAMAQDWVEATIGLTVWWTGDDDEDVAVGSVALTRRSLKKSTSFGKRLVDVNPSTAYLRRLAFAFECVDVQSSDEKGLAMNTLNPLEVGLASIFEGNVEGVMGFLRAWSLTVTSAVAEIAGAGGWLEAGPGARAMSGLDESDLLLLNGRAPTAPLTTRDACLTLYAGALSSREKVFGVGKEAGTEGWELSICILTRLDDESVATQKVRDILRGLPANSDATVDTILSTCKRFGIVKEAREIAEKYADHIIETSNNYGTALIYFAQARCQKKVKDVLDLLISLSLVQSSAYPTLADLDSKLKALISEPRTSLSQLGLRDPEAAKILHIYLTGYATLRKFYDLRDEEVKLEEGQKPRLRPNARKIAAALALVAVITSAADNIHGGLYDEDRGAVVQVDALLALLGEAMVFVNQPDFLLNLPQCFTLLKAIEDLQTVAPRVYSQCEECLRSTLAARRGQATLSSPRELLKKTMSSLSSSFSIVGDSMVNSESSGMDGSGALLKASARGKRGWDWRQGLEKNTKGEDVLQILRLGLAKDIAKHWMAGEGV
ncbi:hypothetical protein ACLMJK_008528 [Lecanora helva]